uniref:CDT1 domain-containing protein n=2 Tax=Heterorhabditis bacteriophora TaxID=37862 RepID=A0A1I7WH89_HETBA
MAVVNVAQCYVDVEASKKPDITVLSQERDESQLVDVGFVLFARFFPCFSKKGLYSCNLLRNYRSIKEYPEIISLQTSYADIREVKTVSKQLKHLIERNWRRAFFVLPPKIQIKILSEVKFFWKSPYPTLAATIENLSLTLIITFKTHMNAADMRRGRHLTQQDIGSCIIEEVIRTLCTSNIEPTFKGILLKLQVEPTVYKVTSVNRTHGLNVSLEDFSRIFARCHFSTIMLAQVYIFSDNFKTQCGSSLVTRKMNVFRSSFSCQQLEN